MDLLNLNKIALTSKIFGFSILVYKGKNRNTYEKL